MSDTTLNGGSVRILWDASSSAVVNITGNGNPSFTVNGSAVTFPYTLSSSTTFDTIHTGDYVVSVKHNGIEVAETPDGTKNVRLSGGGQVIFSPTVDAGGRGKNLLDELTTVSKRAQQTIQTRNDAALLTFQAALGDVANNPVNIAFLGHSMVEGYSSTKYANRFADSAITALRRHMGVTGGLGYKKAYKTFGATDWPITNTGTVLNVQDAGFGGTGALHIGTGYVTTQTISVPSGTTSVDIVWARESGAGTFNWALDGGATTGVSTAGTKQRWQTTRVTTDPSTTHTITITPASGFSRVVGAIFYAGDETKGIRGFEGGAPSNTSAQVLTTITGSNAAWLDAVTVTQPQLLVLTLLCNDYISFNQLPGTNNVSPVATKANLKAIVDAFAAKCTVRPSVVLCIENQRNNIDSGLGPAKWADYVNAGYDLADAEGYAVFDWWKRVGEVNGAAAAAAGLLNADTIHPSDQGHRYWGEGLARFLAPH